jgi:uncharacterized protein with von Willebrand factor type A (vWA) domain
VQSVTEAAGLAARVDLAEVVAAFGQLLHAAGVPVTPERSGRFARAVTLARPVTVDEVYWAGRVTLLTGWDQIETFDGVFDEVFRGLVDVAGHRGDSSRPPPPAATPDRNRPPPGAGQDAGDRRRDATNPMPAADTAGPSGEPGGTDAVLAAASAAERLATKDFAACTPEELTALAALIAALPLALPPRRSRRHLRHPLGRRLDLRATLRQARHTAGDPVEQILRRAKTRPRRLVLIADVSGSMEPYARAYLHLLHGAVRAARAEAFVFATRLTRLTRSLAGTNPDLALRRAAAAAPDWSGGTRIGAALAAFNDGWGRRGAARGAIVVIVSDGWETGDPAVLGEQMARLARMAHRIIWVNPRSAGAAYRPLVAGMAAALPHVDTFLSGHSLAALDDLLAAIRAVPERSTLH